jgi:hypothetical protein
MSRKYELTAREAPKISAVTQAVLYDRALFFQKAVTEIRAINTNGAANGSDQKQPAPKFESITGKHKRLNTPAPKIYTSPAR